MVFKVSANYSSLLLQQDLTGKWNPLQSPISSAATRLAWRDCVVKYICVSGLVLSFSLWLWPHLSPQPLQCLGDHGQLRDEGKPEDRKSGQTDAASPPADRQAGKVCIRLRQKMKSRDVRKIPLTVLFLQVCWLMSISRKLRFFGTPFSPDPLWKTVSTGIKYYTYTHSTVSL